MRKLFLASTLLVAACATGTAPTQPKASLADIATFAQADLKAAEADALAHGDVISAPCYRALADLTGTLGDKAQAPVVGAFSGFQRARDARLTVEGGVPMAVKIACGPLVVDEQMLLVRLGLIAGGGGLLP